jgi:ribosomal protein S18 acetylase RimI-like enzyme
MDIRNYSDYCENEILDLYDSVGWTAYTKEPERLRRAFQNSLTALGAYEDNKLIGVIRAVGDGETILFIQDLLVHPEFQRRGVGSSLIRELCSRYRHVRQIQLTTDNLPETISFYRSLGFVSHSEMNCCGLMALRNA